jgi:hypothetical protein
MRKGKQLGIKIGDNILDDDEQIKLALQTMVSNAHYPPEM